MAKDFRPLQDYLKNVYRELEVADAVDNVEVIDAYHHIVGDFINKLTVSLNFSNGKLFVRLASPALTNELTFKRQTLIDRINSRIERDVVKEIIFK